MIENFDSLKVGDKVIIYGRYGSKGIATIDRITKTEIVVDDGTKFRKSDGMQVGHSMWSSYSCIAIATKERVEKMERERDIRNMRNYIERCLNRFNDKQLESICQLVDTIEEKDKNN